MFCLVVTYVAVVVVVVTRNHIVGEDKSYHEDSPLAAHAPEAPLKSSRKNRLDSVQDTGRKEQQIETRAEKTKRNPFRRQHLENPFGHGVAPDVLLPKDEGDGTDAEPNHLAAKIDPPPETHPSPDFILKAFLEPSSLDEWTRKPLPIRSQAKQHNLREISYPRLNSCSKLIQQWPVDDTPADIDPFLPWIHDVFPTHDGAYVQFVAQNKRRCKTGHKEKDIMAHMQPQVALFQHVPIKRLSKDDGTASETRYRLSSHEEADPDGVVTRFICRFKPSMEETLSEFNFDYDWTALRKRYKNTFSEDDGGIKSIHTSQLLFRCPIPKALQNDIRLGRSVDPKTDWTKYFVDLIPIRTPPRYGPPKQFLQPQYKDFLDNNVTARFDPEHEWGSQHILPAIKDSGRWENIPICQPSLMTYENQKADEDLSALILSTTHAIEPVKKHRLVSCIWASAGYTTRGNRFAINDGQRRLLEWISYNKVIGFDHFYLYDNSGAFSNDTSLKSVADLFPDDVTYIPWPSQICNNNPNNVDSVGERSSQYAAESSCRLRFGPHVDWIGQFDIDEYLIPMGKHSDVLSLLKELEAEDTRIVSFGSWRAWPRRAFIDEIVEINDPEICWHNEPCFHLQIPLKHTMLQAYNCDRQPPGQKKEVMPAEKQLYRPDYVLQHFIHYSAVTTLSEKNESEYVKEGMVWKPRGFPDPRQRFGDELSEALMIHTKAVAIQDTSGWQRMCHVDNLKLPRRKQGLCRLGLPWPKDPAMAAQNGTKEGWAFNCYVNEKVEAQLIPKLEESMRQRAPHFFDLRQ